MQTRDYTSFTSAAKPRFRHVAAELGYEQISGIFYLKKADGWYQSFSLQAAGHGNDFFYVNYGILVPDLCPVAEPTPIGDCGMLLSDRLRDVDETGGFARETKADIEASAARVLIQYRKYALPWHASLNSWDAIAAEYLRVNPIEEAMLGKHTSAFGEDFRAATYGYLLLKANRKADALRWLREAERLLSTPVYDTRDGQVVHAMEKFARLRNPTDSEVRDLHQVRETIALIET